MCEDRAFIFLRGGRNYIWALAGIGFSFFACRYATLMPLYKTFFTQPVEGVTKVPSPVEAERRHSSEMPAGTQKKKSLFPLTL